MTHFPEIELKLVKYEDIIFDQLEDIYDQIPEFQQEFYELVYEYYDLFNEYDFEDYDIQKFRSKEYKEFIKLGKRLISILEEVDIYDPNGDYKDLYQIIGLKTSKYNTNEFLDYMLPNRYSDDESD